MFRKKKNYAYIATPTNLIELKKGDRIVLGGQIYIVQYDARMSYFRYEVDLKPENRPDAKYNEHVGIYGTAWTLFDKVND